nr:trypsin-like peptidase domain-containing protein [Achromobacter ruhlandii]
MSTTGSPPLYQFKWNEAVPLKEWGQAMLSVIAMDPNGNPNVIGTAFVIDFSDDGRSATCMTAAHVFSEVYRLQNMNSRHVSSALAEFLPRAKLIDIDPKLVRAIGNVGDRVEVPIIDGLIYDEPADIALFKVKLQDSSEDGFFRSSFGITGELPEEGDIVCVLAYGNLSLTEIERTGNASGSAKLQHRLVIRSGRVLAHYPNGQRLCKGPCIETSIPVFSGMSGGPLMKLGADGQPQFVAVSALVSSDPDPDDERKKDRSIEGRSIFAALPVRLRDVPEGGLLAEFSLQTEQGVGSLK